MQDTFGRTIEYLRLSITDRCNLRCCYCMPEGGVDSIGHDSVLSYEELLLVARASIRMGIRKIRVTGGEPLIRRGITGFLRELASLPESPEVTLTTNGLLLEEMAEEILAAGIVRINVSLDTLREERFRAICRREGLPQILRGLRKATEIGLSPVKINMVPIRQLNADEVSDFARLSLTNPWEVRFIEFMPVSKGLDYGPESRFPAEEITNALKGVGTLIPVESDQRTGPARLFRYPDAPGRVGIIPAVSDHFCDRCNRLRITADGRVRPCLFSLEEADLRETLRSGGTIDDVERILRGAVLAKPERHRIGEDDFRQGNRRMGEIGG